MKTRIVSCGTTILLLASLNARAGIIAGPITNLANGHDYYLLTPATRTASEAEAENLGGTLAIIQNAAEQEWVYSKFGAYGGTDRNLWIGLRRQWPGGPFAWVTGEKLDYVNWENGQPDNAGGVENCVEIWPGEHRGAWNDASENLIRSGVVEVPGKSNESSLSEKEKALIGTWYASGDREHPCWITGTENKLFQIYDGRAVRLFYTSEGSLSLSNGIHGETVKDRILWSNGTWWSRKPVDYPTTEKSDTGKEPQPDTTKTQ
jgi:hypothetical protein